MASFNTLNIRSGSTVAALPASPTRGFIRVVTDATSPTAGSAPTGGGSARALVWYNGAAWRVIGV